MTTSRVRDEAKKDPETLSREIDETRAGVSRTLEALQARLSPGQLIDQMLGMIREHGGEFARNLGTSVKQNPVPLLLTTAGLVWMMVTGGSGPRPVRYETEGAAPGTGYGMTGDGSRLRHAAESAKDRATHVAESAKGRASQAAGAITERFGHASEATRTQALRAREGFSRMMEEQPLVAGAIALAIGATIGALLPPSEREDRLFGEARDKALEHAAGEAQSRTATH